MAAAMAAMAMVTPQRNMSHGAASPEVEAAARVLEQCVNGETHEANALTQLQHMRQQQPQAVLAALSQKMNIIVGNADAGVAAMRAGMTIVNITLALDGRPPAAEAGAAKEQKPQAQQPWSACGSLLHHLVLLNGGSEKAPKEKNVRSLSCALMAALFVAAPWHKEAEAKLLQYATDRVPSIREKATRGISAANRSPARDRALGFLANDTCTAVRASAVRALPVTAPALLERIDDAEDCVRVQLFHRLLEEPKAVLQQGAAALSRLVAGLTDRSAPVRAACGSVVDAWREELGGIGQLIARCDVTTDEVLGEAVAGALAARYPSEATVWAKEWLRLGAESKAASLQKGGSLRTDAKAPGTVLARVAFVGMGDEERDEALDIPLLLKRTREAQEAVPKVWRRDAACVWSDYLLRQLLHIVAAVDICDEVVRRDVREVARGVLEATPIPDGIAESAASGTARQHYSAIDLAVVTLRRCHGLMDVSASRKQAAENKFSTEIVLLISDICQPYEGEGSFAGRLSRQLQELNPAIQTLEEKAVEFEKKKAQALADEDFMRCHELKTAAAKNQAELRKLQDRSAELEGERDGVCLRVTSIITALLRWSTSDLRRDPALFGTLETILQPMVTLPALSKDVDASAITAICLFCTRDGNAATSHWSLLLELMRRLRDFPKDVLVRARAAVAAKTLADCARLHGESSGGTLYRDELIAAALSLAKVPFHARQLAIQPLCSWLLSLGHVFFEEHLMEPVMEVHWALGWMFVEAFRQRGRYSGSEDQEGAEGDDDGIDTAMAMQLWQFFALLPKLPGKSGAPILTLAVESIVENGLWRRAILQPRSMGFHTRFVRTFSWPHLFNFAQQRLPVEMRFRLWRCSLQLCVTSPILAPMAEVPAALVRAANQGQAPPGAQLLVREAIDLGADGSQLAVLLERLPGGAPPEGVATSGWLLPREEAETQEKLRREELVSAGITDLEVWAPASAVVPEMAPPCLRAVQARAPKKGRGAAAAPSRQAVAPSEPGTPSTTLGLASALATPLASAAPTPTRTPAPSSTPLRTPAAPAASLAPSPAVAPAAAPAPGANLKVRAKTKMPMPAAKVVEMPPPEPKRRKRVKTAEAAGAAGA